MIENECSRIENDIERIIEILREGRTVIIMKGKKKAEIEMTKDMVAVVMPREVRIVRRGMEKELIKELIKEGWRLAGTIM